MQCNNCSFKKVTKEWEEVYGCIVQDELRLTVLLELAKNNKCVYHVKQNNEYDFGFE